MMLKERTLKIRENTKKELDDQERWHMEMRLTPNEITFALKRSVLETKGPIRRLAAVQWFRARFDRAPSWKTLLWTPPGPHNPVEESAKKKWDERYGELYESELTPEKFALGMEHLVRQMREYGVDEKQATEKWFRDHFGRDPSDNLPPWTHSRSYDERHPFEVRECVQRKMDRRAKELLDLLDLDLTPDHFSLGMEHFVKHMKDQYGPIHERYASAWFLRQFGRAPCQDPLPWTPPGAYDHCSEMRTFEEIAKKKWDVREKEIIELDLTPDHFALGMEHFVKEMKQCGPELKAAAVQLFHQKFGRDPSQTPRAWFFRMPFQKTIPAEGWERPICLAIQAKLDVMYEGIHELENKLRELKVSRAQFDLVMNRFVDDWKESLAPLLNFSAAEFAAEFVRNYSAKNQPGNEASAALPPLSTASPLSPRQHPPESADQGSRGRPINLTAEEAGPAASSSATAPHQPPPPPLSPPRKKQRTETNT